MLQLARLKAASRLGDYREQIRAAPWQFGGVITSAARYFRVEPTRLRRYVREIGASLKQDLD